MNDDSLFRRMIDGSRLPTALVTPEGGLFFVNQALCDFLGHQAESLIGRNWTGLMRRRDRSESDAAGTADVLAGRRESYRTIEEYTHADGHVIWGDLTLTCLRADDGTPQYLLAEIADITSAVEMRDELVEARRKQAAADTLYRRSVESAGIGMALTQSDGRFIEVNDAMCDFFGYDAETLLTKSTIELTAPGDLDRTIRNRDDLAAGRIESYRMLKRYIHADGQLIWGDLTMVGLRDDDGEIRTFISQIVDVTNDVRAHEELEESRRELQVAAERYRKVIDNSIIPAALSQADGSLAMVNPAMCDFLGYDAEALLSMTWMDLVAPEDLEEGYRATQELISGQRYSYRGKQQLIHADGHRLFGDLSMGCNRNAEGEFENVIAQIIDITEQVEARDRLTQREAQLSSEIASAAKYVESLLPPDLKDPIEVSSRYLPSQQVGGDCFHYRWIDDDLLEIYLIDVSGHGVRPALLSVSVHNMIRSGSLPISTLLQPDRVLSKLNSLFEMEQHDGAYFSMWYGIYEASTRTLRYASAGSPPALVFSPTADGDWEHTALTTTSVPLGMFADSRFDERSFVVPAHGRMVLFSDGAFELPLPDGRSGTLEEFTDVVVERLRENDFRADAIVEHLRARTVAGQFEDDCSLIAVDFG
jgi:sigma-B regulation protein RsbU (phosphoserine phosphatase)